MPLLGRIFHHRLHLCVVVKKEQNRKDNIERNDAEVIPNVILYRFSGPQDVLHQFSRRIGRRNRSVILIKAKDKRY